MEGAVELAEEVFHMPVRLASPQGTRGMDDILGNPVYATSMGLLQYAHDDQGGEPAQVVEVDVIERQASMLNKMKTWFQGNF
jgi:cell division protein FtsA